MSQPGRTGADDSQGSEAAAAKEPLEGARRWPGNAQDFPEREKASEPRCGEHPALLLEWDPGHSKESRQELAFLFNRGQITSLPKITEEKDHTRQTQTL